MSSLEMKTACERVARAEQQLADAEERQRVAAAKTGALRERLAAVAARRQQVRADLDAGKLDDREAGGLLALVGEDEADLRELVERAVEEESAAAPVRERQEVAVAQAALQQAVAVGKVETLHQHIRACEAALLGALGSAGELLREAGMPVGLRSVWQPSNDAVRAVAHGVLPPPSAPGRGLV
ncbi:hypothetical protein MASR2M16_14840 [Thauera terpenica]